MTNKNNFDKMINQSKDKFNNANSRSEEVHIMTALPSSSSIRNIVQEFNACNNYMAKCAKILADEKGILSYPNPSKGEKVSEDVSDLVKTFI